MLITCKCKQAISHLRNTIWSEQKKWLLLPLNSNIEHKWQCYRQKALRNTTTTHWKNRNKSWATDEKNESQRKIAICMFFALFCAASVVVRLAYDFSLRDSKHKFCEQINQNEGHMHSEAFTMIFYDNYETFFRMCVCVWKSFFHVFEAFVFEPIIKYVYVCHTACVLAWDCFERSFAWAEKLNLYDIIMCSLIV